MVQPPGSGDEGVVYSVSSPGCTGGVLATSAWTGEDSVSGVDLPDSSVTRVLFVCTGNTCRSPMAEMLFRKLAAQRLACRDWELRERGIDVFSAGVAAGENSPASPEAVHVMREHGLDLSQHLSQRVTREMIRKSTLVLALTERHRRALVDFCPEQSSSILLLGRDGFDIQDPIGGSLDEYRECALQIGHNLRLWVEELLKKDV